MNISTPTEIVEGEVELEPYEPPATTLFQTSDPSRALARMVEISKEIVAVIEQQHFYVTISGKKYITCPGWKVAGGMLGLFPYTVWTRPNESQDGYVARVEVRTLDERTIAAAEAECARDESTWKSRPKHALRSMAETRATSRALRAPVEQVFALHGFEGTAAEEMSLYEPQRRPQAASVEPTRAQLREIGDLLATLSELKPGVDWKARAHEISGVPAHELTRAQADVLASRLRDDVVRLVA